MKKIVIVTDAWHPQINGVVTTLARTIQDLQACGFLVHTITPQQFTSIPCPTYPEISLSLARPAKLLKILEGIRPNCVHIATEGPLGWAARAICKKKKFRFTTSYHTRFPEYVKLRWPIPLRFSYSVLRRFHRAAARTMISTASLGRELSNRGFRNTVLWSRGVDAQLFRPRDKSGFVRTRPVFMYVGRVSVEKNLEAFLQLDLPGSKIVVGDGPARRLFRDTYPEIEFTGYRRGKELAYLVAMADVFVFPSLTDTFGVVMLEAMASGVPVAAYPVTGPKELVVEGVNGSLNADLREAALNALQIPSASCRQFALRYSWDSCSRQFMDNLIINEHQFC
jgi:glycosyltransferase involved in cell wall biosynthesis